MLLDFNKPSKIMTEQERQDKYTSDGAVPGTYVPNMSEEDMKKWKGKYIKGKDERVEIRKSINGVQLVVIVYKETRYEEKTSTYSNETYKVFVHKNIHMSANGKIRLSFDEYQELLQVINEAQIILKEGSEKIFNTSLINSPKGKELIQYISTIPEPLKIAINSLEIDNSIFVRKIQNKKGYSYAILNEAGFIFSKSYGEFVLDRYPSDRDENYFKEFRFNCMEDAIICYYLTNPTDTNSFCKTVNQ